MATTGEEFNAAESNSLSASYSEVDALLASEGETSMEQQM